MQDECKSFSRAPPAEKEQARQNGPQMCGGRNHDLPPGAAVALPAVSCAGGPHALHCRRRLQKGRGASALPKHGPDRGQGGLLTPIRPHCPALLAAAGVTRAAARPVRCLQKSSSGATQTDLVRVWPRNCRHYPRQARGASQRRVRPLRCACRWTVSQFRSRDSRVPWPLQLWPAPSGPSRGRCSTWVPHEGPSRTTRSAVTGDTPRVRTTSRRTITTRLYTHTRPSRQLSKARSERCKHGGMQVPHGDFSNGSGHGYAPMSLLFFLT